MHQSIVRAKVRSAFERINAGDYMVMVDAMIRWWQRTLRLLPDARFDIQDVLVNGGPWRTRVAVRSLVSGDLPGGGRYENTVFQFLTLSWGNVTSIETAEDLQVLERALRSVASAGEPEALARPIAD
ncbi:hypothetical protein FM104_14190 [Microbacterium esteraromaticum]|uniref:SnoaL-like domain-containing protein n=1 Tax=Microbacterium esteraromaticum TaxID=57043 RepID=A0A1R4KN57_9MICO|nr:nuclear transport factor 2 family protein [Microbacterium esteraromaticum]MDN5895903.1 nuclear transport factor 2 family protein [Nocardioides sp.]SJN45672.1 hypothetical protein FM104_14190 [Microbacterium esteraromaticum]